MNETLTLGSLFSGSGGFELAGIMAGIRPIWSSEVLPFATLVTHKRLPDVKHYGDVSKLKGSELEPVDTITFGSPCQDLSIAGRRAGIVEGSRSNLFFEAVRIIKEMREATNGKYPRYAVWENVPGIFSSNNGDDFRIVLEELCSVKEQKISIPKNKWTNAGEIVGDAFSVAWRVLDAQYFGVAQRRKRVFIIADFGSQCAGEILFESAGMPRDSQSRLFPWQRNSDSSKTGLGETGFVLNDQGGSRMSVSYNKVGTLRAQANHPPLVIDEPLLFANHAQDCRYDGPLEESPTIVSRYGTGGNTQPLVVANIPQDVTAFGICSKDSNAMLSDNPLSGFYEAQTSRTLDCNGGNPCVNQGAVVETYDVRFTSDGTRNSRGHCYQTDISRCLDTGGENPSGNHGGVCVLTPETYASTTGNFMTAVKEKANTLAARDYKDPQIINTHQQLVRRLTPHECAKLQGFPSWWCEDLAIPDPNDEEITFWLEVWNTWNAMNGKRPKTVNQVKKWLASPYTEAAEYAMFGNAICLNVGYFVLSGIAWAACNLSQKE